ncbi:MAG: 2-dehydro-3-deoxygalactonokinase [Eubacteriales bacterium]|nr:2-dehydro-3-deoxygalactonokinase [Eubacteriales bacterium]
MEKYVITLDGGTTNTRCILWDKDKNMLASAKREVGVRNTSIDGNNEKLKKAVRECIEEVLNEAGIKEDEVSLILSSGMVTSELGLYTVPWISAPAGKAELAANMKNVVLSEISRIPFSFIPGIKNSEGPFDMGNIADMDIMRGEEAESIAIIEHFVNSGKKEGQELLLVLPGSHNKFIPVNGDGQIMGCITSISGELLSAITNDTIVAKSVEKSFVSPEAYEREMVIAGFETARAQGLGKACFTARTMMLFMNEEPQRIANFILGASIAGDLEALKNTKAFNISHDAKVVVSGKEPLRNAIADILRHDGMFTDICEYENESGIPLSALGQYIIAEGMD